jgi:hypothetical protein
VGVADLDKVRLVDVVRRLVVLGLSVGELPTHICVHRPVDAARLLHRLELIHGRIATRERREVLEIVLDHLALGKKLALERHPYRLGQVLVVLLIDRLEGFGLRAAGQVDAVLPPEHTDERDRQRLR